MSETWKLWNPSLDNDDQTLGDAYKAMPVAEFKPYSPFIIRMFENPDSFFPLPGKCSLLRHDMIHILLGRGLLVEDEAFVIGYTMGTSRRISFFQKLLYKIASSTLYPAEYRFRRQDLPIFELGFIAGQRNKIEIYNIEIEKMQDKTLGEIRRSLGINKNALRAAFSFERFATDSSASNRIYGLAYE
jgi:ubiquinone biosynthesis protein Coq4